MRKEKQLLLDEIGGLISGAKALVLTKYTKLPPNAVASFRLGLAGNGSVLEVVRKRILLKAAQSMGVELNADLLEGHVAVIVANRDPIQTTKMIYQFCQDNEGMMEVLGGRFEGALCSAKDFEQISKLPSLEVMRSEFLGTLEAPLSQTLAVMDALLTSVLHCIDNKTNS